MDDEMKIDQEPGTGKEPIKIMNRKSLLSKRILYVLATILLMFVTGVGAFFWRDSIANDLEKKQTDSIANYQDIISKLQAQIAIGGSDNPGIEGTPVEPICTLTMPDSVALENIKASITSGNTAALEGYMLPSVNVILAATEAYGAQTPSQAIADVSSFISEDINSWDYDFDLPASTISQYSQGYYGQYFPVSSLTGKASNGKIISFSFDCDGKISTIFMANSESIL